MAGVVFGVVRVSHHDMLRPEMEAIFRDGMHGIGFAARADVVVAIPVFELHVAGIEDMDAVRLHEGASRIDARDIGWLVRIERAALVAPGEHIVACLIAPALDAAVHIEGCVLEIGTVAALILAEAVGVVQPAHGRHQVEELAPFAVRGAPFLLLAQPVEIAFKCSRHADTLLASDQCS